MGDGRVMAMRYDDSSHSRKRKSESRLNQSINQPSTSAAEQWTEHVSSSGKKYYYNPVSEISQWEKPKSWIAAEEERRRKASQAPDIQQIYPPFNNPSQSHSNHSSPSPDIVLLPPPESDVNDRRRGDMDGWTNGAGGETVRRQRREPTPPPPVPGLSPDLERFARPGLEQEWRGWNAIQLEQQADLLAAAEWKGQAEKGAGKLGQLAVELKCARSLVRTAEIRSTLLEQRLLFVKEQYNQLHSNTLP